VLVQCRLLDDRLAAVRHRPASGHLRQPDTAGAEFERASAGRDEDDEVEWVSVGARSAEWTT